MPSRIGYEVQIDKSATKDDCSALLGKVCDVDSGPHCSFFVSAPIYIMLLGWKNGQMNGCRLLWLYFHNI